MKQMNRALMVAMIAGSCSMVSASAWARDPISCQSDADCPADGYCLSGGCAYDEDPSVDECQVDADCAAGLSCQVISGGGECPPSLPNEPSQPCTSRELRVCVPPPPAQCDPAQLSADCSGAEVCVTYTFESCSGGAAPICACADDSDVCECGDSKPQEPSECTSEAVSYCVPPYLAPCSADADCGAGFTCEQQEVCTASCAGTDPAPGNDGEPGGRPDGCESSCAPSGQSYCKIIERTCASAADCGAGFVCESFGGSVEPGGPATCTVDPDGNTNCAEDSPDGGPDQPISSESYCLPEGWQRWGVPGSNGGVDYENSIGGGRDGEVVGAESARPPRQDGSGFPATDDGSASGGCQVGAAGGAAGSGMGLLALIAGVFGLRRRRD